MPVTLRLTGSGVNAVSLLRKQSVRVNASTLCPHESVGHPPPPGCQFFNTLLTQVEGGKIGQYLQYGFKPFICESVRVK